MRRVLITLLLSSTVAASAVWTTTAGAAPPLDDRRRGLVHRGLRPAHAGGQCRTAYQLATTHGGRTACSHGPDPAPEGVDVRVAREPRHVAATDPGAPTTVAATQVPC